MSNLLDYSTKRAVYIFGFTFVGVTTFGAMIYFFGSMTLTSIKKNAESFKIACQHPASDKLSDECKAVLTPKEQEARLLENLTLRIERNRAAEIHKLEQTIKLERLQREYNHLLNQKCNCK